MEKLDLKDIKILNELDHNSRQSYRSIGRKVGLSKDVVIKRIKKLEDNEIITSYYAIVDYAKLGYVFYRFYFSFQNVIPQLKTEIIDYFTNKKITDTVVSIQGSYDLLVGILVRDFPEAQSFWLQTLKKYGKYFSKKVFSAFCQEDYYGNRFLLKDSDNKNSFIYQWYDSGTRVDIDKLDSKIIELIAQDSKIPTTKIANNLNASSKLIQNRIKKLRDKGIIIGYKINVNLSKLGYHIFKVDIDINKYENISKITKYATANPHLVEVCKTIGYVDLELCFACRSSHELHDIMEDISNKFPDSIKNYKYFSDIKVHKIYGFDPKEL